MTAKRRSAAANWEKANAVFLDSVFTALAKRLEEMAANPDKSPSLPSGWLASADEGEPPALLVLRDLFDLSPFEMVILALCAAHELDGAIGPLCGRATGDETRPWPTFALALKMATSASWDAVSSQGALRSWRLIEVDRLAGQPLVQAALRCDDRILDFIKGLDQIDDRLLQLITPVEATQGDGDPAAEGAMQRLYEAGAQPSSVMLYGADGSIRLASAATAAAKVGRRLFRIDSQALPSSATEIDSITRLWRRETRLGSALLLVEIETVEQASEALLHRFMAKLDEPVIVSVDRGLPSLLDTCLAVEVEAPDATTLESIWKAALGKGQTDLARRLANSFDLGSETIRRIAAAAAPEHDPEAIWRACAASLRPRLDALAHRIEPRASWDDLVATDAQRATLRQIADQVRLRRRVYDDWGYRAKTSRGLGVNALFAGESGTGKTMAAEVLAHDLGLNLYRIDLSQVVSKYIGETEKNLRQLFDAAERGGSILLFDEADALFGKRSEVKDSHDRYANIEVNYLLQRIESFTGLSILATNMKASLDTAFLRRMRFVVQFPYPGPVERAALWRGAFPKGVPIEALGYDQLARINLTGGNIAAAAINATFLAAADETPVHMGHVLSAARAEMAKLNRPINEADFVAPVAVVSAKR